MFIYEKRHQFPIDIKRTDVKLAKALYAQLGGQNGELGACLRYFAQSFTMPDERGKALLTDIGTEELAHIEMICTMIYQLTKGATPEEMKAAGLSDHYVQHGLDAFPANSSGVPFSTEVLASVGDYIANIYEDMAAEQKARAVYEHLIDLATDLDVIQPLLYLRQREIVHFNRFKELLEYYQSKEQ